jgi:formylglycine-generating enzyme required for sulfatase activity
VLKVLDHQPGALVVVMGALLGSGLGIAGVVYLRSPAWMLLWGGLFVALWRIAASAEPIFEEANPVVAEARPTRVQDGPLIMMELPGGQFLMGSPDTDEMASASERPQHTVTVSGFRMAVTPVTAGLYNEVMQRGPVAPAQERVPAVDVRWEEALDFCNRLSVREGYRPCYRRRFKRWVCDWRADGYRLPTEAEWEYACRAGTATRYAFGDDPARLGQYAWFADNAAGQVQAVGQKWPNRWGLYDMHGNVWEWCWDWYGAYGSDSAVNPVGSASGDYRVVRGGSFVSSPEDLRSAVRGLVQPELRDADVGFRCARVPPALGR